MAIDYYDLRRYRAGGIKAADGGVVRVAGKPARLPLRPHDCLQLLRVEMDQFAAIAQSTDLTSPIRLNKKWALSGLVRHLGGIHLWAASIVRTGKRVQGAPKPPRGTDLGQWYRSSADELHSALENTDPTAPCWNFTKEPRTAAFWFRRQLHETVIHGRDADTAAGAIRPIAPRLAADGIDEVLGVMLPVVRRWGSKLPPRLSAPMLLHARDSGHRWLLDPTQDAFPAARRLGTAQADAAVYASARAEDLLLLLWGRVTSEAANITFNGDRAMAVAFLQGRLTP